MEDGLCCQSLDDEPRHIVTGKKELHNNFFDIGMKSMNSLCELIKNHDIIFWNGTLGVVENEKFKYVNMQGWCVGCLGLWLFVDYSISLLLSYSIYSGVLGSPGLLLSYSMIALALHNTTIILITTHESLLNLSSPKS